MTWRGTKQCLPHSWRWIKLGYQFPGLEPSKNKVAASSGDMGTHLLLLLVLRHKPRFEAGGLFLLGISNFKGTEMEQRILS